MNPLLPEKKPSPERKQKLRDNDWRIYKKVIAKCELGIERILSQPDDLLSVNELSRLLDIAERHGRLAAGLPVDPSAPHSRYDDDCAVRPQVASAITKIYSEPLDVLITRMHKPPTITLDPPNEPSR